MSSTRNGSRGDGAEPLGDRAGVLGLDVVAQHRELVAAEAGRRVAGAQDGRDPVGELDQDRVAGGVTEPVVHRLEPVEVEVEQVARPGVAAAVGQHLAHPHRQQRPVRQTGERVVEGLMAQLGLALLAVGDVLDVDDHAVEVVGAF